MDTPSDGTPPAADANADNKDDNNNNNKKGVGGIKNLGNTCYMGAALQALANVTELSNFLIQNEKRLPDTPIVKEYVQMIKTILKLRKTADPMELKAAISRKSPFAEFAQHDSQEFIQFFVNALHESLMGILRGVTQGVSCDMYRNDGTGGGAATASAGAAQRDDQNWRNAIDHWRNEVLAPKKGSAIYDLFAGQSVSELRCPKCAYSSKKYELFTMLSLQIPIPENAAISFRVISREEDPIKCSCHEIRLPLAMKLSKVKKIICRRRAYISVSKSMFILLNKNNKSYNEEFSQKFNDAKTKRSSESDEGSDEDDDKDTSDEDDDDEPSGEQRLRDIPLDKIDIWCFKRLFKDKDEDGQGDRLICISLAQRFTGEKIYSVDAPDADQLPFDVPLISINHCLADFVKPENIDASHCTQCSNATPPPPAPRTLVKQMSFMRLPDILIVSFKRFIYDPVVQQHTKQRVPVSFPLDNFNPGKYFSTDVPAALVAQLPLYSCIAVVTHLGMMMTSGHYCSFVRDGFTDNWVFCNDEETLPAESSMVDTRNAYIVFYQRADSAAAQ
ncbi:hypothetical protein niasHT_017518 [Heterodera trifolii]|uniref:ubiquitinyl hydrolase 1 n=1 Tax=Heterodera trifolii TaxID=157864 RepID=A0ABD2L5W8_9BILA